MLASASIFAQPKMALKDLPISQLPAAFTMDKSVKKAFQWKDAAGTHSLIFSETGAIPDGKTVSGNRKAEITAFHFLNQNPFPSWKIYDFETECPVDVEAFFITEAIEATDLDQDGHAEIWIVYKTTCRGDISGRAMKIIMYENGVKHALRGFEKIITPEGTFDGGSKFDAAFAKASEPMRDFAAKKWERFGTVKL